MRKLSIILFCVLLKSISSGQEKNIKVSGKLEIIKLSEHTYIHTCDNSNGIVYIDNGEAIIVSTPPAGDVTKELINWVKDYLKVKIVAYVIDSWHPDNMEGLDVVHAFGIKSYSCELTQKIAKVKGLPVPQNGFKNKMELRVGNKNLICRYFGSAHTEDGIVIWIPDEKILFGGNAVRNYNGWVGNIADANVDKWSETIEKVKVDYGSSKIVIPGHGNHGGAELLDYTINLYKPGKWGMILKRHNIKPTRIFNDYGKIFTVAEQDSIAGKTSFLKNATVFVDKGDQYVMIESPFIQHDIDSRTVKSEYGRIKIFKNDGIEPDSDYYYKKLIISLRDDAVKIVIILAEFIR